MNNLKEYLTEKDERELEDEINEDVATFVGSALGYTIAGTAAAFGATLLALGGVTAVKGIVNLWRRIFKKAKSIKNPNKIIREIKVDPKINKIKKEVEERSRKYSDVLKDVYGFIEDKEFNQAKEAFSKIPTTTQNNPDVQKAIMTEITRVMKLPPLYVISPGNKTYQAIKKVLNIRVARAAAKATEIAFENTIGKES